MALPSEQPGERPSRPSRRAADAGAPRTPVDPGACRAPRSEARRPVLARRRRTRGSPRWSAPRGVFNASEYPRRVAGLMRSLGAPAVCVRPAEHLDEAVRIVVAWELCWYRYEVDLTEERPLAQAAGAGHRAGPARPRGAPRQRPRGRRRHVFL